MITNYISKKSHLINIKHTRYIYIYIYISFKLKYKIQKYFNFKFSLNKKCFGKSFEKILTT